MQFVPKIDSNGKAKLIFKGYRVETSEKQRTYQCFAFSVESVNGSYNTVRIFATPVYKKAKDEGDSTFSIVLENMGFEPDSNQLDLGINQFLDNAIGKTYQATLVSNGRFWEILIETLWPMESTRSKPAEDFAYCEFWDDNLDDVNIASRVDRATKNIPDIDELNTATPVDNAVLSSLESLNNTFNTDFSVNEIMLIGLSVINNQLLTNAITSGRMKM